MVAMDINLPLRVTCHDTVVRSPRGLSYLVRAVINHSHVRRQLRLTYGAAIAKISPVGQNS
jgi:hypothetical protein